MLWFVVLVLLLVFVVFFKQKPSPLSGEFSLLTPSGMCDSSAVTGSFLCWAGCGSSAALPKGESGDESNSEIHSSKCLLESVLLQSNVF